MKTPKPERKYYGEDGSEITKASWHNLKWREKHPEKYQAGYKKRNNAAQQAVLINRFAKKMERTNGGTYREREIIQLHTAGKDLGTIVVRLRIPASIVSQVIQAHNMKAAAERAAANASKSHSSKIAA